MRAFRLRLVSQKSNLEAITEPRFVCSRRAPAPVNPDAVLNSGRGPAYFRLWSVMELPSGSDTTARWQTGVSIGPYDTEYPWERT